MSDILEAIYTKMAATSAITDLVGTRIYLREAPQGVTTPYLTYFLVDPIRGRHFNGRSCLVRSRIQVDVFDTTVANAGRLSVIGIANAIRDALDGFQGTVDGVRIKSISVDGDQDLNEPEDRLARRQFDLIVWHDE